MDGAEADSEQRSIFSMNKNSYEGLKSVVGGFLIHLVLGTLYLWGNITNAVTSYIRRYESTVTYNQTLAVFASALFAQGLFMFAGGILESRIGARNACLIGGYTLVLGVFLSSFATSLVEIILYNGMLFGVGLGICYAAPIACASRWMPNRKGIITGVIVAGFGLGACIFGWISMALVNPKRLAVSKDYYDPNSEVPSAVPHMYRVLSVCYFVLITIGSLMLSDPPTSPVHLHGTNESQMEVEAHAVTTGGSGGRRSLAGVTYQSAMTAGDEEKDSRPSPVGDHLNVAHATSAGPATISASTSVSTSGAKLGAGTVDLEDLTLSHTHIGRKSSDAGDELGRSYHLGPAELLRTPLAWHLASCLVTTTVGGMYLCGTYKTYALQSFSDEAFLSAVGSTSSVFSAAGRIFWGALGDRIGAVETLMIMSLIFSIIIATYAASPDMGKAAFAIWTFAIFFFEGGNFALYMPVTMNTFGSKYGGANYGLIFSVYSFFVVLNITILAGHNANFLVATRLMGVLTFVGFINLYCFHRQIRVEKLLKK